MQLIVEEGLQGLTIGSLATRVEAAVGAIYRYFPSKSALIAALQVRVVDELREVVRVELAKLAAQPSDAARLAAAVAAPAAYFHELVQHPARRVLINRSMGAPDPLLSEAEAEGVNAALLPLVALAAAPIGAAVESGLLRPGVDEERALLAWAGVQGLTLFLRRDRFQPAELRAERLLAPLLGTLLRGWGAEAGLVEEALALLG